MAAGLGFKDFVTGEVLTAADVDGYLMQGVWVFASAAARDAAVTSPQEGNFAYLKDTNVTTYYTGSAWANLDTTGMTNPMTTTGDTIYSSSGSTPARLGIGSTGQVLTVAAGIPSWATPAGGSSTYVGCAINNNATLTIANETATAIACGAEEYDSNGFHDNSTNNSRMTIPSGKAGKYQVTAQVLWGSSLTTFFLLYILKNGSVIDGNGINSGIIAVQKGLPNDWIQATVTVDLAVGDYVQVAAYQTSGSNKSINSNNARISLDYLGA